LPHFWGMDGVWRTAPISDGLSAALTASFIFFEMRKMKQEEEKQGWEDGNEESGLEPVSGSLCSSEK